MLDRRSALSSLLSTPHDPVAPTRPDGQVASQYSHEGYTIVSVRGEIDIATAPALMQELADAVGADRCRVIVDLTQVTFMDSTGLNALTLARHKAVLVAAVVVFVLVMRLGRRSRED